MEKFWSFLGSPQFRNIILLLFAIAALWFVYEFSGKAFAWHGYVYSGHPDPINVKITD